MKQWTGSGRTVDDAVAKGLKTLGLRRDQVDVQVVNSGGGFLGMLGLKRAEVRLLEKRGHPGRPERGGHPDARRGRFEKDRSSGGRNDRPRSGPKERGGRRSDEYYEYERRPSSDRPNRAEWDDRSTPAYKREARTYGRGPEKSRNDRSDRNPPPNPRREENRYKEERFEKRPSDTFRRDSDHFERQNNRRPMEEKSRPENTRPDSPPREPAGSPIPPEQLLSQWKDLFGWQDLTWDIQEVHNRRLPIVLSTATHADILAGQRGRVLEAFEYLFNLISSNGDRDIPWVHFRINGKNAADEQEVIDLAHQAAREVSRDGQFYRLPPMPASLRRLVHQTLADHPDVETFSEGEGPWRKVVVRPRDTH